MRNRKIQKMVKRGEITHAEGVAMAQANARANCRRKEEPISYRNSEGYADPTAYFAMQNMARSQSPNRRATQSHSVRV